MESFDAQFVPPPTFLADESSVLEAPARSTALSSQESSPPTLPNHGPLRPLHSHPLARIIHAG